MKDLTQFSKERLAIIENFILFLTHCSDENEPDFTKPQTYTPEELYRVAYDYVLEDHVDGENSEDAYSERLLNKLNEKDTIDKTKIIEECFLADDTEEKTPLMVFTYFDSNEKLIFVAIDKALEKPNRYFQLVKPLNQIITHHRWEILEYCLGTPISSDEVSHADIFIHGKYLVEL